MKASLPLQRYYFPDRLWDEIEKISSYPLTVIEAPSGFGKTTVVREYLNKRKEEGIAEHWYTCFGESVFSAWQGICDLFSNVSDAVACDLLDLKEPSLDTLFHMTSCLKDIRCDRETYLVVDNYQLMDLDIPFELLNVLSMHDDPLLHIVFITQQLRARQGLLVHNDNVHSIGAQPFFFDLDDTRELLALEGIQLKKEELESIYANTEGWVSAIRLQILNYQETRSVARNVGIEQLVERAIWNRLSEEEQAFFLSVSVFESFSALQAARAIGEPVLPPTLSDLLIRNDFIKHHPDKNLFSIHGILKAYVDNIFEHYTETSVQLAIYKRAGDACLESGDLHSAAMFYRRIDDYEAILSLPFTREHFAEQREKGELDLYSGLLDDCPAETLLAHPFALLSLGYMALDAGLRVGYLRVCELIQTVLSEDGRLSEEEKNRLQGEWSMLQACGSFNDIVRMLGHSDDAWQRLKRPSEMLGGESLLLFGAVSPLSVLWRRRGTLAEVTELVNERYDAHRLFLGGLGAGIPATLRAEAKFMAGEDEESEILCYKAQSEARNHGETGVLTSIALLLARIAILRGDGEAFHMSLKELRAYARGAPDRHSFRMAEHALAVLGSILQTADYRPQWVSDTTHLRKVIRAPEWPVALLLHLRFLIDKKRYNELHGLCRSAIDSAVRGRDPAEYPFASLGYRLYQAEAAYAEGKALQAHEHAKKALDIALPDAVYLPFAVFSHMQAILQELGLHAFEAADDPKGARERLLSLCERKQSGIAAVNRARIKKKSPLAPREREIALLAQKRWSAKEIGEKLFISDTTVRATLRNVYRKLGVHSRAELSKLDL